MKICAIICEFNPFHNGHKYLIESAQKSACDAVICIMSGNFTQRGEICILDKHTRAKHAILCGADAVLELPVAFSVAPAEIFAKGAIKILSSIPEVTSLAFGCENDDGDFMGAAQILLNENSSFKKALNDSLNLGNSYIKSYADAFEACGGQKNLLSAPNNILGVEYAKAVAEAGGKIELLPIRRVGAEHSDGLIQNSFSSSKAIRDNLDNPMTKQCVPECVYGDLRDCSRQKYLFGQYQKLALAISNNETLNRIYGCSEGLDCALTKNSHLPYEEIISKVSGKRYTRSRIRRILLANLLKLYQSDAEKYLNAEKLYIKPLAIKDAGKDPLLSALAKSENPLLLKEKQINLLYSAAKNCLKSDIFANDIYNLIFERPKSGFEYPEYISAHGH